MSRRPARFTQADVARAIRAIKDNDPEAVNIAVEFTPDGTIRVVSEPAKKPTVPREVIL